MILPVGTAETMSSSVSNPDRAPSAGPWQGRVDKTRNPPGEWVDPKLCYHKELFFCSFKLDLGITVE